MIAPVTAATHRIVAAMLADVPPGASVLAEVGYRVPLPPGEVRFQVFAWPGALHIATFHLN